MNSGEIRSATLESGETIEYVFDANAPRGGMKHTFFTPDKRYAVQFFNDPRNAHDPQIHDRIRSIVSIYNPTVSEKDGGALGKYRKNRRLFQNALLLACGHCTIA